MKEVKNPYPLKKKENTMRRYVKNEKASAKSFSADFKEVKKGLKQARAVADEKRWKEMAKFYESDESIPTLKKSKSPSEKELQSVRKKLEKTKGTLAPPKKPTLLEKFRYDIQQKFVAYILKKNISKKELAKILRIGEATVSKLLKNRIDEFSTDKLITLYTIINPKIKLKIV